MKHCNTRLALQCWKAADPWPKVYKVIEILGLLQKAMKCLDFFLTSLGNCSLLKNLLYIFLFSLATPKARDKSIEHFRSIPGQSHQLQS